MSWSFISRPCLLFEISRQRYCVAVIRTLPSPDFHIHRPMSHPSHIKTSAYCFIDSAAPCRAGAFHHEDEVLRSS